MCYNNCPHFYSNTLPGEEYCKLKPNQQCPEEEVKCEHCDEDLTESDLEYGYCPTCERIINE